MTDVSVVIPVRDDAEHLRRCLEALAAQTVPPAEVVVVDNASTDDSAAVARSFGARVVPEPRVGIPAAAATGYDAAACAVVARLDADSLPPTDWVERVVRALDERPDAVAVTGAGTFADSPPVARTLLALLYLGSYYALGFLAAGHHVLWGSSMALRRSAWELASPRVHRDDPELHDDMDLALVLGPRARIALVPGLSVGVSARSLRGGRQWRRRMRRAFRTLSVNWADAPPWERWAARLAPAARHTPERETT
ncbi:glycosyltransferase family A protein [Ornithinimicrobium humiphilum]|uniref:Glycosyl transferase family 2 n=1 Tax=Ornithinimicrobium humiphilum TaxID=125288 RepID=A0A543KJP7_9MICO|nr:glycosyltransferase family 2 protein [Ornithinimicrobium humiphilum]TQM95301.1 glycosyl transferase family 2 [Ornithinimicrobium humiphilum]